MYRGENQCFVRHRVPEFNQFPIVKPSVTAGLHHVVGYFCKSDLIVCRSSLVVVVKRYAQDDFQWYPNNLHFTSA